MKKFTFTGDIRHPGKVTIKAESKEAALALMSADCVDLSDGIEYEVSDEQEGCLGFTWGGDDPEEEE